MFVSSFFMHGNATQTYSPHIPNHSTPVRLRPPPSLFEAYTVAQLRRLLSHAFLFWCGRKVTHPLLSSSYAPQIDNSVPAQQSRRRDMISLFPLVSAGRQSLKSSQRQTDTRLRCNEFAQLCTTIRLLYILYIT